MKYFVAIAWVILTCLLGYLPSQQDFYLIIGLFGLLFFLYLMTYRVFTTHRDILFFVFVGLLCRFCLLFSFPNLSDDIYRFLWDGHIFSQGINPYLYTPTEWMSQTESSSEILKLLYPQLNSPDYYSIYPPICQGIFWFAVKCFPESTYWSTVVIKFIFLISETLTIYILLKLTKQLGISQRRVLLYVLNPLIIIELVGNLHFEAIMILFLMLALWSFYRNRFRLFGGFMAFSIATKLLPLMFLPFFLKRLKLKNLLWAGVSGLFIFFLLVLPFSTANFLQQFGSSLELYFQKFEFNASLYYVLRWLGYQWKGYNMIQTIGPFLSYLTVGIIVAIALLEKKHSLQNFFKVALLSFTLYLALATTVHPWYLSIPILLSVFTYFRFPIFWSALIFLTYVNYSYQPYHENLWFVSLEYVIVVMIFFLEYRQYPVAKIIVDISRHMISVLLRLYRQLRGWESPEKKRGV